MLQACHGTRCCSESRFYGRLLCLLEDYMVANLLMPSPVALMVLVVAVLVMRLFCIRPGRKAASASPYRTMVVLGSGV